MTEEELIELYFSKKMHIFDYALLVNEEFKKKNITREKFKSALANVSKSHLIIFGGIRNIIKHREFISKVKDSLMYNTSAVVYGQIARLSKKEKELLEKAIQIKLVNDSIPLEKVVKMVKEIK